MADIKISALPPASTIVGTEVVPLNQSGVTSKATVSNIFAGMVGVSGGAAIIGTSSGSNVQTELDSKAISVTVNAALENARSRMAVNTSAFSPAFDYLSLRATQSDMSLVMSQVNAIASFGTGPFQVDAGDTATNAQCQATISNPSTRYTSVKNGDGSYTITGILAALRSVGLRSNIAVQANQTLYALGTFPAVVTGNALEIGFDSSSTPGTYQFWSTGNVFFAWRENGAVIAYNNLTSGAGTDTPAAGYTFALQSGSTTTFTSGDALRMDFVVNATKTGGLLTLTKNGTQAATYAVNGTIFGNYCAAMRMQAQVATITSMNYRVPFSIPAPTPLSYDVASVLARIVIPSSAQPTRSGMSSDAELLRATPAGFGYVPILPLYVRGFGDVETDISLRSGFMLVNGTVISSASVAFVEKTGNDSGAILGDPSSPFLTIQAALNSAARLVVTGAGSFDPFSLRADQASGAGPKMVVARVRGSTFIRVSGGDDISAATWTLSAGMTNVWETTLVTTQDVDKVLLTDTLDARGFPVRARLRFSVADLEAAGRGWYFDTSVNKLYVALGGASVQAQRSRLRACYLDAAGTSRIFVFGAELFIGGLYLENIQCLVSSTGGVSSKLWSEGNIRFMSPANAQGIVTNGSHSYSSNDRNHATAADSYNYNSETSRTSKNLESNCYTTDAGDVMTYGVTVAGGGARAANINASSSHNGYVTRYAHVSEGSYGPEIADTSSDTFTDSATWQVGDVHAYSDTRGQNIGVGIYGSVAVPANSRRAWLDTCISSGESVADLRIETNAVVKTFDCTFPLISLFGASAPTTYSPSAP